jgi:hypothetical protein
VMTEETKAVEISVGTVVLKKMKWGETNSLLREAIGKARIMGGETLSAEFDIATYRELLITKSLQEVPAGATKTVEWVRSLSQEDGEKLFAEAQALNPFLQISR